MYATLSKCVIQVCMVIVDELLATFLKFPEVDKLTGTNGGCKKFGFSKCGAAIDGSQDILSKNDQNSTLIYLYTFIFMFGQP